jgi:hypothetical protein
MSRDLGNKHVCFKCEAKFYDLKKPVPACPKCGADQRDKPAPTVRAGRKSAPVAASRLEAAEETEKEAGADAELEGEGEPEDEAD